MVKSNVEQFAPFRQMFEKKIQLHPTMREHIRPGASLTKIREVEEALSISLPPSYVQFLLLWDGVAIPSGGGVFGLDSLVRRNDRRLPLFPPNFKWIIFGSDGAEDYYVFDTNRQGSAAGEYLIMETFSEEPDVASDYNSSFDRWVNSWALRGFSWRFGGYRTLIPELTSLEQLFQALELDLDFPAPRTDLGALLYYSLMFEEAVDLLRETVLKFPDYYWAWHYLGCVERELGNATESLEAFRQAMKLPRPGYATYSDARTYYEYRLAALRFNRPEEGAEISSEHLVRHPKAPRNLLEYLESEAERWYKYKRYAQAAWQYEHLLIVQPDRADVRQKLAECREALAQEDSHEKDGEGN